jgi:hypothetical protein
LVVVSFFLASDRRESWRSLRRWASFRGGRPAVEVYDE